MYINDWSTHMYLELRTFFWVWNGPKKFLLSLVMTIKRLPARIRLYIGRPLFHWFCGSGWGCDSFEEMRRIEWADWGWWGVSGWLHLGIGSWEEYEVAHPKARLMVCREYEVIGKFGSAGHIYMRMRSGPDGRQPIIVSWFWVEYVRFRIGSIVWQFFFIWWL